MLLWSWLAIGLANARSFLPETETEFLSAEDFGRSPDHRSPNVKLRIMQVSPNTRKPIGESKRNERLSSNSLKIGITVNDEEKLLKEEDPKEQAALDDWCAKQFPTSGYDCATTATTTTIPTITTTTTTTMTTTTTTSTGTTTTTVTINSTTTTTTTIAPTTTITTISTTTTTTTSTTTMTTTMTTATTTTTSTTTTPTTSTTTTTTTMTTIITTTITTTTTTITSITSAAEMEQTTTTTTTIQPNNNLNLTAKLETSQVNQSVVPTFLFGSQVNRVTGSVEEQKQAKVPTRRKRGTEKMENRSELDEWCKEQFKRHFDFVCNSTTVRTLISSDTSENFTDLSNFKNFTNKAVQVEAEIGTNLTRNVKKLEVKPDDRELRRNQFPRGTTDHSTLTTDIPMMVNEKKTVLSNDVRENLVELNLNAISNQSSTTTVRFMTITAKPIGSIGKKMAFAVDSTELKKDPALDTTARSEVLNEKKTIVSIDTNKSLANNTSEDESKIETNLTRNEKWAKVSSNTSELFNRYKSTTSNPLTRTVAIVPIEKKTVRSVDTSENFTKLNDSESFTRKTVKDEIKIETNLTRNVKKLDGTVKLLNDENAGNFIEEQINEALLKQDFFQKNGEKRKMVLENIKESISIPNLRKLLKDRDLASLEKTTSSPGLANNREAKISVVETGNDQVENRKTVISKDSSEMIESGLAQKTTGSLGLANYKAKISVVKSGNVEQKANNEKTVNSQDPVETSGLVHSIVSKDQKMMKTDTVQGYNLSNNPKNFQMQQELNKNKMVLSFVLKDETNEKTINTSQSNPAVIVVPIVLSSRLNEKRKEKENAFLDSNQKTVIAEDSSENKPNLDKLNPNLGNKVISEGSFEKFKANQNRHQMASELAENKVDELKQNLTSTQQVIAEDLSENKFPSNTSDHRRVFSENLLENKSTDNPNITRNRQVLSEDMVEKKFYTANRTLTSKRQEVTAEDSFENKSDRNGTVLIKRNRQLASDSVDDETSNKQQVIFKDEPNNLTNNYQQVISEDTIVNKFYTDEVNQTLTSKHQQVTAEESFENKFATNGTDSFLITKHHQVVSEGETENKAIKIEKHSRLASKGKVAFEESVENKLPETKLNRKVLSEDTSETKLAPDRVNASIVITNIDVQQSKNDAYRQLKTDPRINITIVLETRVILGSSDQQVLKNDRTPRKMKQDKDSDVDSAQESKGKNGDIRFYQINNGFPKIDSKDSTIETMKSTKATKTATTATITKRKKAILKLMARPLATNPKSTADSNEATESTNLGSTDTSSTESTGETDSSDETSEATTPEEEEPDDQPRVASDSGLPDCDMEGIVLFKKILYEGDAIGFCLKRSSKCVDLPKEWDKQVVSAWVQSHKACYVLWSSPDCDGMDFKINQRKVRAKKTQNFYDNSLAKMHSSIRVCNQHERTHE